MSIFKFLWSVKSVSITPIYKPITTYYMIKEDVLLVTLVALSKFTLLAKWKPFKANTFLYSIILILISPTSTWLSRCLLRICSNSSRNWLPGSDGGLYSTLSLNLLSIDTQIQLKDWDYTTL